MAGHTELSICEWSRRRNSRINGKNITPFGISSVTEYLLEPPPVLTSHEYAKTYNEGDDGGKASTAQSGHKIARTSRSSIAASLANSGLQSGRPAGFAQERWHFSDRKMLVRWALVNMAMNDRLGRGNSSNKYHYNFLATRKQRSMLGDTDGNPKTDPDPNFVPLCHDSMFPSAFGETLKLHGHPP